MMGRTRALLDRLPAGPIIGVEVGVFRGKMSAELLAARDDLLLVMVDSWLPEELQHAAYRDTGDMHAHLSAEQQDANYAEALRKTAPWSARRIVFRSQSVSVAAMLPMDGLDFVFLDGDHSFPGVIADIQAWAGKVHRRGLMGGHDYAYEGEHRFRVRDAVDHAADVFGWTIDQGEGSTWFFVTKTDECERQPEPIMGDSVARDDGDSSAGACSSP